MHTSMRMHAPQAVQHSGLQRLHTPSRMLALVLRPAAVRCGGAGEPARQQHRAPSSLPARRQQHRQAHMAPPAAAATATEEAQAAVTNAGVKGLGFYTGDDGYVYCDSLRVDDIRQQVPESPFYLYSRDRITNSYKAYSTVGSSHQIH